MESLVTVKELADLRKLTESTVYELASQGKLPAIRFGKSWRFEMDNIRMLV